MIGIDSTEYLLDDRADRRLYTRRSFTRDLLPARNTVANEPTYLEYKLHKHVDASRERRNNLNKKDQYDGLPARTVL